MRTFEVVVRLRGEGYSERTIVVKAIDREDAKRRAKNAYMLQVEAIVLGYDDPNSPGEGFRRGGYLGDAIQ
jgi:hypothetical protein